MPHQNSIDNEFGFVDLVSTVDLLNRLGYDSVILRSHSGCIG